MLLHRGLYTPLDEGTLRQVRHAEQCLATTDG